MSDYPHIIKVQEAVQLKERELRELKRAANTFCQLEGLEPIYHDADEAQGETLGGIRSDSFYGRPLATNVKDILNMRKRANQGAATVNEIHDLLVRGGYQFETKNTQNSKRSLRISLTKNPAFHKLPNGAYGMKVWYPAVKEASGPAPEPDPESVEADQEDILD